MTVISPNSIAGVTSITAQDQTITLYSSNGTTISQLNTNINATSGVSTVANLNATGIVTATTFNVGAAVTINSSGITVGVITATTFSGNVTGNVSGNITIGAGSTSAPSLAPSGDSNTGVFFPSADTIAFAEGGTEAVRFDSSGRLLVGTTSVADSSYKVQIGGHADETVRTNTLALYGYQTNQASGSIINQIIFGPSPFSGAGGAKISQIKGGDNQSDSLAFFTGGASLSERMRVDAGGRLLINTANPVYNGRLCVEENAESVRNVIAANNTAPGTTSVGFIAFYRNSSFTGGISNTNNTTAYNTSSDYRLKENVTAVTDGIVRLQQLKPCRFNFITDADKTVDGFIAHEVQEIVPEAITGEKDGIDSDGNPVYQGIDQSKLVPLLTAALQEAIAEIETLKAQNAAILARLDAAGI